MAGSALTRLLAELRRRRVVRVAIVYAIAGWLVIQVAATVLPTLHLPDWTVTLVVVLVVLGFVIVLDDPAAVDRRFQAIFNEMNNALIAGDKATAMAMLNPYAQFKYGPVFDLLMPNYAQIATSFAPLKRSALSSEYSEYVVTRNVGGIDQVFLVYFVKGADGVWRKLREYAFGGLVVPPQAGHVERGSLPTR